MIKYKLFCKECDLKFDSWFASSNEYERLKNKKLLNCHNCNYAICPAEIHNIGGGLKSPKLNRSGSRMDDMRN